MALYMLDTDISSYIMKRSDEAVLRKLQTVAVSDVCISVISKAEILYGIEVSPRRQKDQAALDEFLRYVEVLDFPAGAALDYALIRADLKRRGTPIGGNDLLIAAHTRYLGLTLATNNTREYWRVPGLKIENWTEPVN
jgi:tRNA(fMet)-specific endonuclease VapC